MKQNNGKNNQGNKKNKFNANSNQLTMNQQPFSPGKAFKKGKGPNFSKFQALKIPPGLLRRQEKEMTQQKGQRLPPSKEEVKRWKQKNTKQEERPSTKKDKLKKNYYIQTGIQESQKMESLPEIPPQLGVLQRVRGDSQTSKKSFTFNLPNHEEQEIPRRQPQNHQQSNQLLQIISRQQDETLADFDISSIIQDEDGFYPPDINSSCCIVTDDLQYALQIVQKQGVFSVALRPFDRNNAQKFQLLFQNEGILIKTRQNQKLIDRYDPLTGHPNIQAIPLNPFNQSRWTYWRFKCRQIQSHIQGSMSGRYKICLKKYFLGVVYVGGKMQARLIEQLSYDSFNERSTWIPPYFWRIVDV